MNIIIPMAGRGSRLRPHTLTVPKPLIPVAGKPIVQRLVEDIVSVVGDKVDEIAFVIGDFGPEVEADLLAIAKDLGATGKIYHQDQPLGTAHAIYCAKESLTGNCIVAFADTLFRADFTMPSDVDGAIWVKQIEDPSAFGVVKLNEAGQITDFVEKPTEFVSDLAIIGIYYFKDGDLLKSEIEYLLDNDIKDKGEYQLTNALENMKQKGKVFVPGEVKEWLDCGNKAVTVYTNKRVLSYKEDEQMIAENHTAENSVIIPPCFIGEGVVLKNTIIGPHVSVGRNTVIENSVIKNTIIQNDTFIENKVIADSMVGNKVVVNGKPEDLSIGDFTVLG